MQNPNRALPGFLHYFRGRLGDLSDLLRELRRELFRGKQPSSLRGRVVGGAFWSVVSSGLSQFLGLIVNVLCARVLGKEIYGELGIILTTITLFMTVAGAGLGVTATKHVAEYRVSEPKKAGILIGMSYILSIVAGLSVALFLVVLAPWLASHTMGAPVLSTPLRLAAITMLFTSINSFQISVLSGFEEFNLLAKVNFLRGVLSFPIILAGALYWGLLGTVTAYSVVSVLNFVLHNIAIARVCKTNSIEIEMKVDRKHLKMFLGFSLPVLVAGLSFTPASWYANTLLAKNGGYSQYGLFSAAFQWQAVVLFLANAVGNIGLPVLSSILPERNFEKYCRYLKINFVMTTGSSLMLAVPVAIGSKIVMSMYGEGFKTGAVSLIIICIATVFTSANITVGHAIWSLDAPVAGMVLSFVRSLSLVIAAFFLTPLGAIGLALAYLTMSTVQSIVQGPFMFFLLRDYRATCAPVRRDGDAYA